jgi:DNA repair protein RadD
MLRDYQQKALDDLYAWFAKNPTGNPCLVLPTGSGKSHIIAALVKDAVQNYAGTRVLMLTHVKELIAQNAEKMREHWSNAPMGIYSASLNKRCLTEPITFAGIQSIVRRAKLLGHIDLIIVDEAHSINHGDAGNYRKLINQLKEINPDLRVVGLTASPYRLGHGMIHEGDDVIFDALIEPIQIESLIDKGYLAPLRSKHTEFEIDVDGVKKRGGEFIAGDLERAVDTNDNNVAAVKETIRRASDRKSWLVFCTGVAHAQHLSALFESMGVTSACVTGETPQQERADILQRFKAGEIRALTNMNVLTTGFDYPGIDCLVMLRPTMSPGLYLQMAGRGMRIAPEKDDCIVLDFAGNVKRHGPITAVEPPNKKGKGIAPSKVCPQCSEIILAALSICNCCGFEFPKPEPEPEEKTYRLHDDDIMGFKPVEMKVTKWKWLKHLSRTSGKEMLRVTYYGKLSDEPITEYLPIMHEGYAGEKARLKLLDIAKKAFVTIKFTAEPDLDNIASIMNCGVPPHSIVHMRQGKWFRVQSINFTDALLGTAQGVAA